MKTQESGCIEPSFLDPGTSWRLVVSPHALTVYPQGKSPWIRGWAGLRAGLEDMEK
jgi:hypothetical protein